MTEVQAQVPQTGTRLRITSDRPFETQSKDSVLRLQAQSQDGQQTFDGEYVEVEDREADAIAKILRNCRTPEQAWQDRITQEVLAAYGSKLNADEARTISTIVARAQKQQAASWLGGQPDQPERNDKQMERMAERFERAAAQKSQPQGHSSNGEEQGGSGRSSGRS